MTTLLKGCNRACIIFLVAAAMTTTARAQIFTNLVYFNGTNGQEPFGTLVQGKDGNLYGTTAGAQTLNSPPFGTVFKMTPEGALTTLYTFCSQPNCTDGSITFAGLVQGSDGNFYGTRAFPFMM